MYRITKIFSICYAIIQLQTGVVAADVVINVNNGNQGYKTIAGVPVAIHPLAIGINFGYETTDAERENLLPILKGKVKFLRWPEGNKTSYYSHHHPNYTTYRDPRRAYNAARNGLPENHTDVHEFIAFCRAVGAEPVIGLPLGSGYWSRHNEWNNADAWTYKNGVGRTPVWRTFEEGGLAKEVYDFVRLINVTKKYGVKYFYVGNEFGHHSGPFFDTFGREMEPHERDHGYLEIYSKVKEVSPDALILNNSIHKGYNQDWWPNALIGLTQGYGWSDYYGTWPDAILTNHYQSLFENLSFADLNKDNSERGSKVKHDFLNAGYSSSLNIRYEWGLARGTAFNLSFLEAGIVNAWNQLEQLADGIDMSAYWPMKDRDRWLSGNYIYGNDFTPTGHLIQFISENIYQTDSKVIQSSSTPSIYTMAVKNDRSDRLSIKVFIINKSSVASENVTLRFAKSIEMYPRKYSVQFASTSRNAKDNDLKNYSFTEVRLEHINKNNIRVIVPPLTVTAVILDKTIAMGPLMKPVRADQNEKEWVFVLPKEARIDSLGIRTNKKVKRDYTIYFRKKFETHRGSNVISRSGSSIRDIPRNRFVENTNGYGHEIRVVWKTANAPDTLGLNVYGYISRDAPVVSKNARCSRQSFVYENTFYDAACGCPEPTTDLNYYLTTQNVDGLTCYHKALGPNANTCVRFQFSWDNTVVEAACGCPALGPGFYRVQETRNGHQCYHRYRR